METKAWALITFTILTQTAIGSFILFTVLRSRNQKAQIDSLYRRAMVVVGPVAIVGMLASLAHLGTPLLAPNSILNLGSSWLSREIFFTCGFVALWALGWVLEGRVAPSIREGINWLTAICGLADIVSMASIYSAAMMPAWKGINTYAAFLGTAFFLGAALAAATLVYLGRQGEASEYGDALNRDLKLVIGVALTAMAIQLVILPWYLVRLAGGDAAAQASAAMLSGQYGIALILRWALALIGGLLPLAIAWRRGAEGKLPFNLVYGAALAILVGEVVGRYLFYVSAVKITLG